MLLFLQVPFFPSEILKIPDNGRNRNLGICYSFFKKFTEILPLNSEIHGENFWRILYRSSHHGWAMKKILFSRSLIHLQFQNLFKADHSWPWVVPLRVSPRVPVAFRVDRLVLHRGNTRSIICNYGDLSQQLHEKSILRISCTYRRNMYSWHVSDYPGKPKQHISNYWVSNENQILVEVYMIQLSS